MCWWTYSYHLIYVQNYRVHGEDRTFPCGDGATGLMNTLVHELYRKKISINVKEKAQCSDCIEQFIIKVVYKNLLYKLCIEQLA